MFHGVLYFSNFTSVMISTCFMFFYVFFIVGLLCCVAGNFLAILLFPPVTVAAKIETCSTVNQVYLLGHVISPMYGRASRGCGCDWIPDCQSFF